MVWSSCMIPLRSVYILACSVNFCRVVLSWDRDLGVAAVGQPGPGPGPGAGAGAGAGPGPGPGAGAGAGVGSVVAVAAMAVASQRLLEHSRDFGSLLGGRVHVGSGTSIH